MDKTLSRCDGLSQTERLDGNDELHRINNENISRITYLYTTLDQKDNLIKLLLKEKNILEGEKDLLQKEQQSAIRDKESIVMRFATVEKNLIDLKIQLEQAVKRENSLLKEYDTMSNKLKLVNEEKIRITVALDLKDQEHIHCLKDIETMRRQLSFLENKSRLDAEKLRKELECKNAFEKKLHELQKNLEINQKTDNNEYRLDNIAELKASQIMLTHVNTEKAEKIQSLEKQLEYVNKELKNIKMLLVEQNQKQVSESAENNKLHRENIDLQNQLDNNVMKVAELQAKVNELETLRAKLSISEDANFQLKEQMLYVRQQLTVLTNNIHTLQKRESELLALNQELGSLNAMLQNDISLHESTSMVKSMKSCNTNKTQYDCRFNKLQDELDNERKIRFEERLLMARHLVEKSKECDTFHQKLLQVSENLNVMKKKHAMLIKDLQREIASLQ